MTSEPTNDEPVNEGGRQRRPDPYAESASEKIGAISDKASEVTGAVSSLIGDARLELEQLIDELDGDEDAGVQEAVDEARGLVDDLYSLEDEADRLAGRARRIGVGEDEPGEPGEGADEDHPAP
jgi:hypothetical protein